MKKGSILFLAFLMMITLNCGKSTDKPETPDEKNAGYAVGYDMATRTGLTEIADEIEVDSLLEGIKDALYDKEAKISEEEQQKIIKQFQDDLTTKQLENRKNQGEKNKVESKAFLEKNAKKEGVKVTASGLQYEVIREGTGARPTAADRVKVNYRGTLIDGSEFDSSYKRGEPAVFTLQGIIPGWQEGLQLMKVGAKYRFVIPSDLAYGEQGSGLKVAPFAALVFDIELLGIEPPQTK